MKSTTYKIKQKIKSTLGVKPRLPSYIQFWRGDQGFRTRLFLTNYLSHLLDDKTQVKYKFNVYSNNGNLLYTETRIVLPQQSIDIEIYSEKSPYGTVIVDCSIMQSKLEMVRQSPSLYSHFYVFYENRNNKGLGLVHTQTSLSENTENIDWYSSAILDEYDKVEILALNPSSKLLHTKVGVMSDFSYNNLLDNKKNFSLKPKSCQIQNFFINPNLKHQRVFIKGFGSPNSKPHIFAYKGETFTVFHS
ncbi:MAG: hypothetical protein HC851_06865 [Acaryochloris sp. RU_4_1]|nr:hypothetical protein [Acaryochloris sp. RU_4_1]NJR53987.1 hypothetical protein [Acaryochloris sp. CRU_2_0]